MSDYLFVYVAGAVAAVILSLVKVAGFYLYAWLTKSNVVAANLRKVNPRDQSFAELAAQWALALFLAALLSWISVLSVLVWDIPVAILRGLRELFSSTPESVKGLRFALRNNPQMSAEAVFAHLAALSKLAGANVPTAPELLASLDEVKKKVSSFQPSVAVEQLAALSVSDENLLSSVRESLRDPRRAAFFEGLRDRTRVQDDTEYWAFHTEQEALQERYRKEPWPEYYAELATLEWKHRAMLWRRNGWFIRDFKRGPWDSPSEAG